MQRLAQWAKTAGLALVAAGLVGCGSTPPPPRGPAADAQWVANANGVIDQLDKDVFAAAPAGADLSVARRALRNDSDLFVLLVAYTDFGGCGRMVAAAGPAPPRFLAVTTTLSAACARFESAARLFTRATSRSDPRALVAASRQVGLASRLLYRAMLRFAAERVKLQQPTSGA